MPTLPAGAGPDAIVGAMRLLIRWAAIAAAVWIAAWIVPGIDVTGGWTSYFVIAAVFALVNLTVGGILRVVAFPFILLTLGLGLVVINALMFGLTARLTDRLAVDGVLAAVLGSVIISVASSIISRVASKDRS